MSKQRISTAAANRLQALKPFTLTRPGHIRFRFWARLYRSRFPYREQAPITSIADSINKGESELSGLLDADSNHWAAFTLLESYSDSTLLAYLATAPQFEGQGLAKKLVHQLLANNLTADTPYFWLEAAPKLWPFYQKLGFKRLDLDYRIPDFHGSGSEKMGLFVVLHDSVENVRIQVVESFVSELLLQGYQLKQDDPRYGTQMQVIKDYPHDIVTTL